MISAALGLTNLLPIPALDGGRLLFLLIEIDSRPAHRTGARRHGAPDRFRFASCCWWACSPSARSARSLTARSPRSACRKASWQLTAASPASSATPAATTPSTEDCRMYCRRCGATLHQGVVICPECGARQRRGISSVRCARCGHRVSLGLTVCPHCGRDVHPAGPRWGLWLTGFAVDRRGCPLGSRRTARRPHQDRGCLDADAGLAGRPVPRPCRFPERPCAYPQRRTAQAVAALPDTPTPTPTKVEPP